MHSNQRGKLLIAMTSLALSAPMAFAQAGADGIAGMPIDELKRIYLACDRVATRQLLDMGTAAHCSMVGEALQKRAFDDSFDQLLAWWRDHKDKAVAQITEDR
jgi:hypothetical protein